jgi:hypothetical protein
MVFAIRDEAKLVVEGGYPIDLGSRDLEMTSHLFQDLSGEKPSGMLNCLEDAQEGMSRGRIRIEQLLKLPCHPCVV